MADMRASVILRLIDRLTGPARRAAGAVGGIQRALAALRAKAMAASAAMTSFGSSLISRASIAAVALGGALLGLNRQILSFDEKMNQAAATAQATPAQFARMKLAAEEMGRTTRFTATQAAEALTFLSLAGLGVEKSIAVLPFTLDLAAATGTDLANAARISTGVLAGFGLKVHQLSDANDILAKATATSKLDITQLGEAMTKAAPIARFMGVGLADTVAVLGKLADQNIVGGIAGRGFARALFSLPKQTKRATKAWKALGGSRATNT